MLEIVKADMKAGWIKDWGDAAGGGSGYFIGEAVSATELFTNLIKWMPYVQFEVMPVLTINQTIGAIKKAVAAMKK